jgi:hypothetical protein
VLLCRPRGRWRVARGTMVVRSSATVAPRRRRSKSAAGRRALRLRRNSVRIRVVGTRLLVTGDYWSRAAIGHVCPRLGRFERSSRGPPDPLATGFRRFFGDARRFTPAEPCAARTGGSSRGSRRRSSCGSSCGSRGRSFAHRTAGGAMALWNGDLGLSCVSDIPRGPKVWMPKVRRWGGGVCLSVLTLAESVSDAVLRNRPAPSARPEPAWARRTRCRGQLRFALRLAVRFALRFAVRS